MEAIEWLVKWVKKHLKDSLMIMVVAFMVSGLLLYTVSKFHKDIVVVIGGVSQTYNTSRSRVKDALDALNIKLGSKDKVSPSLTNLVEDGMTITIYRALPLKVTLDGRTRSINSSEETVGDMLKSEGIILNQLDRVSPSIDTPLNKGLEVKITRVCEKLVTNTEKLPYNTTKKKDNDLERGKTKVLQDGADGEKEVIIKVTYEDGEEVSRVKVSETITKQPVNKIVAVGTVAWFTSSRGRVVYTNKLRMKATSYTSNFACTGKNPGDKGFGITATGTKARRDPNGYSTVAVDPRVIPLGTKLYIEGYGYAIAEDTGGGVRKNIIDLYFEPGTAEFRNWYTHYTNVYILK